MEGPLRLRPRWTRLSTEFQTTSELPQPHCHATPRVTPLTSRLADARPQGSPLVAAAALGAHEPGGAAALGRALRGTTEGRHNGPRITPRRGGQVKGNRADTQGPKLICLEHWIFNMMFYVLWHLVTQHFYTTEQQDHQYEPVWGVKFTSWIYPPACRHRLWWSE